MLSKSCFPLWLVFFWLMILAVKYTQTFACTHTHTTCSFASLITPTYLWVTQCFHSCWRHTRTSFLSGCSVTQDISFFSSVPLSLFGPESPYISPTRLSYLPGTVVICLVREGLLVTWCSAHSLSDTRWHSTAVIASLKFGSGDQIISQPVSILPHSRVLHRSRVTS